MSSEVNVYVVYDTSVKSVSCQELIAVIRASHPHWLIEERGSLHFDIGQYDWAPVHVFSDTHQIVQEEAQEMAESLESASSNGGTNPLPAPQIYWLSWQPRQWQMCSVAVYKPKAE